MADIFAALADLGLVKIVGGLAVIALFVMGITYNQSNKDDEDKKNGGAA